MTPDLYFNIYYHYIMYEGDCKESVCLLDPFHEIFWFYILETGSWVHERSMLRSDFTACFLLVLNSTRSTFPGAACGNTYWRAIGWGIYLTLIDNETIGYVRGWLINLFSSFSSDVGLITSICSIELITPSENRCKIARMHIMMIVMMLCACIRWKERF